MEYISEQTGGFPHLNRYPETALSTMCVMQFIPVAQTMYVMASGIGLKRAAPAAFVVVESVAEVLQFGASDMFPVDSSCPFPAGLAPERDDHRCRTLHVRAIVVPSSIPIVFAVHHKAHL